MQRLRGKTAIITGAGSGIGRSIATIFASEGAQVSICGRTLRTIEETAQMIRDTGGEVLVVQCDVSNSASVESLVAKTVQHFGKIDILVNNAGVRAGIYTILELTEDEWDRTLEIDAKGSWLCSKYAIPEMKKVGGGSIIMISSISAHIGQVKQGAYNVAKAGQELLMRCMALDFAADNIRVNSVCPAWVLTEMNREQLREMQSEPNKPFPPGISYQDVLRLHPIGRIGDPEDVAWATVYLASDESKWVTGISLMVDGGYTCQ